jgi:hypothetical protein
MEEFFPVRDRDLFVSCISVVRQQTDVPIFDQAGWLALSRNRLVQASPFLPAAQLQQDTA